MTLPGYVSVIIASRLRECIRIYAKV